MTKALKSVAALQLLERGLFGLEDPVATHLPEFGELQVLDGFDGDTPILRAPSRPPVVRELMTHSSGVTYFFTNAKVARFHEVTGIPHVLTGAREALTAVPLAADPGTVWDYGTSTDWLGLLVEQLSGRTLDAYLDEHVIGPLGMQDVTFDPSEEQRARTMPVHVRTPDGGLAATEIDLAPAPDWWAGGHGLFGTAEAYGRLIRANAPASGPAAGASAVGVGAATPANSTTSRSAATIPGRTSSSGASIASGAAHGSARSSASASKGSATSVQAPGASRSAAAKAATAARQAARVTEAARTARASRTANAARAADAAAARAAKTAARSSAPKDTGRTKPETGSTVGNSATPPGQGRDSATDGGSKARGN
jgi:CubicO group peptidase (beta-lactamase class C family)